MIEFNALAGRYRDAKTKRFISWSQVERVARQETSRTEKKLAGLYRDYQSGNLDQYQFESQFQQTLKESYIVQSALGKGGIEQLNKSDYGKLGNLLKEQYARVERMSEGIRTGEISEKQVQQRIRGYSQGTLGGFYSTHTDLRELLGYEGMRFLNPFAKHCASCIRHQTDGYVDAKEIIPIGTQCECRLNCRCGIKWRKKVLNPKLTDLIGA
jgi:hypothetical protein